MARYLLSPLVALAVLASTLSAGGTASASAAAPAAAPAAASVAAAASVRWEPARNYVMPPVSTFGFPNRSAFEKTAIRNRVLFTIQGVWGGPRDRNFLPLPTNGTIRIATWSFADWAIARALVAAHRRGASVQIMAAAGANQDHGAWNYLKRQLGQNYYKAGVPGSSEKVSFARDCRGSCRGPGGTPHSKYFLFDNVGSGHQRHVSMQTSMNLTKMGYSGQWNQAQTSWSAYVYDHFLRIYGETRINRPVSGSYRRYRVGPVLSMFFPFRTATSTTDPVMQALKQVRCASATAGGTGRTVIRVIQYAVYDTRGLWLARKLRSLWNAGCDVKIIYAIATRPVLEILRSGSGRGAIPMRQSVITNRSREIVKYNHSKWMTIAGNWGSSTGAYVTFSGSANWSTTAFTNDEQMQQIENYGITRAHMLNFNKTWSQGSSHAPGYGSKASGEGRLVPSGNTVPWGTGAYKYLNPDG